MDFPRGCNPWASDDNGEIVAATAHCPLPTAYCQPPSLGDQFFLFAGGVDFDLSLIFQVADNVDDLLLL